MNDSGHEKPRWKSGKRLIIAILVAIAFGAGYFLPKDFSGKPQSETRIQSQHQDHSQVTPAEGAVGRATVWTCSMHPQIRLPKPGKCPICFMDLIPLASEEGTSADVKSVTYTMSDAAKKLAEVETAEVRRRQARVVIRMVGMVFEDETRIASLTSRVDGRLDEIYVNFTGDRVERGNPMVKIWSPTLIKSQVELFEALRYEEPDPEVVRGAEEKLIQQGLTREQVEQIKKEHKPIPYVILKAPISGIVMKRMAVLGQFVKEGSEMYTINDLSKVWVKMDAYESDLPWIRYGQDVTFTSPAVPGRQFKGRVLFIDPTLDGKTRSVKIRVEAENPELLLKPGMFVSAELEAEIDAAGRVIKSEWVGKYICPVHPRDNPSSEPGTCPDSNMPLKPASAFGYAPDEAPVLPLVIPATAPLITGKRAVVYVEVHGTERPTYELREVVLGPRAGHYYVVYNGLKEGERVVTRGNFKIDSAMQILARSSMMNERDETGEKTAEIEKPGSPEAKAEIVKKMEAPHDFLEQLNPLIADYLVLKDLMVDENVDQAKERSRLMANLLGRVDAKGLHDEAAETWNELSREMTERLNGVAEGKSIEAQRQEFAALSEAFARVLMGFRHARKDPVVLFHCPMGFDGEGAYWIEESEERKNPYFGHKPFKGQAMLQCGELVEKIPPESPKPSLLGGRDTTRANGSHEFSHGGEERENTGEKGQQR
ncbi:MAG: efflux RND transporter periplasmic adaptor subunit [Thermodesulfobacteriota bacterium]